MLLFNLIATLAIANTVVAGGGSKISQNGKCGSSNGLTCLGSDSGNCCSQYGYCGDSDAYCGKGCQSGFGECGQTTTPPTGPVSKNGRCGSNGKGATCYGSDEGDCCSVYGMKKPSRR